jgi:hypothetical protein
VTGVSSNDKSKARSAIVPCVVFLFGNHSNKKVVMVGSRKRSRLASARFGLGIIRVGQPTYDIYVY